MSGGWSLVRWIFASGSPGCSLSHSLSRLGLALQRLEAGDVTAFVVAQCRSGRRGRAWSKTFTSGLRSLFRYLHVAGWVPVGLAQAVPPALRGTEAATHRALCQPAKVANVQWFPSGSAMVKSREG